MNEASILDIISPIMIGPSSSHTAGAVKLGLLARNIYGEKIKKAKIILYNSYAQTGVGHGTDKAVIAGLLGFSVDDVIIKDVFNSLEASKIEYRFEYEESFSRHPNAVDFILEGDINMIISAQSVGGGEVQVIGIDNFNVNLDGKYNALIIVMDDTIGLISKVTDIIQNYGINIASLNCDRKSRGSNASCCICIDGDINLDAIEQIKNEVNPHLIRYVKKIC